MTEAIEIRSINSRKDLMAFIKFPWKIYANDPHWVPPLIMDRLKTLDGKKNPFFKHNPAAFFLAYKNGELVGRIAAIINHQHNQYHQDKTGFFGFLEAIKNQAVFETLLNTTQDWLRQRGCDRVLGPTNPSTNDEIGFLVDGFEAPPFFMMPHNPPYYNEMMQALGYEKVKDVYAYYLDKAHLVINKKFQRASAAVLKKFPIKLNPLDLKKLNAQLEIVRNIYNDAWSQNWGFVPLTREEFEFIANDFKKIVDPDMALIAEYKGEPIGFCVFLPNYNEIFMKFRNGKLLPFNWLLFLLNKKKIRGLRGMIFGIKQKYWHLGLASIFYMETIQRGLQKGYEHTELSWILEDNQLINQAIHLIGGQAYKTYRVYGRPL